MADEVKIYRLLIDAQPAKQGAADAIEAMMGVDRAAGVAGGSVTRMETSLATAGGAARAAANDMAAVTRSVQSTETAYRGAAGAALELMRANVSATEAAQQQAAGFARLAQQQNADVARAASRDLMASVQNSTDSIRALYGSTTKVQTDSVRTMAAGLGSANSAASAFAATQSRAAAATDEVAKSVDKLAKMTPQQRLMLGYQLNDIFTQLASGSSPALIAAQQGPQITQIFGGLKNTLARIPTPLLAGGAAALGVGVYASVLDGINKANDAIQEQQRRLGTLLGSQNDAAAAYRDIAKFASETGTEVAAATEKFIAFGHAAASLGVTRQGILGVTSTAEKLTQISGASPGEGSAAQQALAAMLQSSTVSAEQLRTVLGTVPQIADKIAAGLGVSVTQLQLMAAQGQLTNQQVFEGLLKQGQAVDAEFQKMPKSLGSTFRTMGADLEQLWQRFSTGLPFVREYRMAVEGIAAAAHSLNEATTPATPAQRMASAGGPSVYSDLSNRLFRGANNPGAYYSAQYDLGIAENNQTFSAMQAAAKAASDGLLTTVAMVDKLDPVTDKLRTIQQESDAVEKTLGDLIAGNIGDISSEQSAEYVRRLTDALRQLRAEAESTGSAADQALRQIGTRYDQDRRSLTPGQRDLENRTQSLLNTGETPDRASAISDAQQLQTAKDMVDALEMEAKAEEAKTAAMRSGKPAMIDAAVAAATLAFSLKVVAGSTEEAQVKMDVFAEQAQGLYERIFKAQNAQAGIDASKQYIEQLDGISAAMKVVEQGAYAMKRAEAEAKAARADNGTGGLQMQVFDAQQALTDATTLSDLRQQIDLTNKLAAAAGDVAKQKAIQLDYDIRIAQQNAAPGARADIDTAMRAKAAAELNRSVDEGTAAMDKQVDVLKQEIDVMRSGSADYAAQVAMLQKKNDLIAQGVDVETNANAQRQITLAGDLARLKEQADQIRQVNELWTEPLKQALQNIQTTAADAWEKILDTGNISFQSLGETFSKILKRMAAEFLALATVRPVMSVVVQALGGAGIVSPTTAAQLGYPMESGGGAGGGGLGSILGGGLGGGYSGGGWLGDIGDWLRTPLFGESYGGAGSYNSIGDLISQGSPGVTPLGMISGLGSIAMGAYSMLSGNGSTGSIIGGAAGMAGGLISMLGPMMGMGAAAGPVGLGVGLVGGLLGGLFGGGGQSKPKIPPPSGASTVFNFNPGTGLYDISGTTQYGGAGIDKSGRGSANAVFSLMDLAGGNIANPAGMYGGVQWVNYSARTSSAGILAPGNVYQGWNVAQDSTDDPNKVADQLAAAVFAKNVVSGAIDNVSKTLVTAFQNVTPSSIQEAQNDITMSRQYDNLVKGDNLTKAEQAFQQIDDNMASIVSWAREMGLAIQPLEDAKAKQQTDYAQSFVDNIESLFDPLGVQLKQLADERDQAMQEAQYIKDNVTSVYVDMAKVAEYYTKKEADLREQFYASQIDSLQSLIQRLTYGDLSNASPLSTLSGSKASYTAALAQAQGGDQTAIDNLSSYAEAYVTAARGYYASAPEYQAIVEEVRAALAEEMATLQTGGSTASPQSANDAASAVLQSNAVLSQTVTAQQQQLAELTAEVANLTAQLKRYASANR